MRVDVFGLTDVGRRRENNQDHVLVDLDRGIFAIADGMGGHAAGEVASQIAIEALADTIGSGNGEIGDHVERAGRELEHAVLEGNRRICESVLARGEWRGMGTTIVALRALEDRAVIGHVGDSRAYRLRGDTLTRLTDDHSWVGEQVRLGLLTEVEARRHPMRNIVTRAMGNRPEVDVELNEAELLPGDVYLLCSDGLNSMLQDDEIRQTLVDHAVDPEGACRMLVERANARGGEDNISVIVLRAQGDPER